MSSFWDHNLEDREDGLAHCLACGGGEGSLPTHCPGVRMTDDLHEGVLSGRLDYIRGSWWRKLQHEPVERPRPTRAQIDILAAVVPREEALRLLEAVFATGATSIDLDLAVDRVRQAASRMVALAQRTPLAFQSTTSSTMTVVSSFDGTPVLVPQQTGTRIYNSAGSRELAALEAEFVAALERAVKRGC